MNNLYFQLIQNLPTDVDSPIAAKDLAEKLRVTPEFLRKMINTLREQGYAIGSRNVYPNGYWLAQSFTEIEETIKTLVSHAASENEVANNLQNATIKTKRQALKLIKKEAA